MTDKLLEKLNFIDKEVGVEAATKEYIKIMVLSSEKQAKSSMIGMIASIILSLVSIGISIGLAYTANKSSQEWQTKQLPQLEAINKNTKSIISTMKAFR